MSNDHFLFRIFGRNELRDGKKRIGSIPETLIHLPDSGNFS